MKLEYFLLCFYFFISLRHTAFTVLRTTYSTYKVTILTVFPILTISGLQYHAILIIFTVLTTLHIHLIGEKKPKDR